MNVFSAYLWYLINSTFNNNSIEPCNFQYVSDWYYILNTLYMQMLMKHAYVVS